MKSLGPGYRCFASCLLGVFLLCGCDTDANRAEQAGDPEEEAWIDLFDGSSQNQTWPPGPMSAESGVSGS